MANYLLGGKKSLATLLNENLVNNISSWESLEVVLLKMSCTQTCNLVYTWVVIREGYLVPWVNIIK
jgi:hypothetical protein